MTGSNPPPTKSQAAAAHGAAAHEVPWREDDRVWLVKTGDRILGPYTGREIEDRLLTREIVSIDETAAPTKRWRYLREEPWFAKALENLRRAQLASRETTELSRKDDDETGVDFAEQTAVGVDAQSLRRESAAGKSERRRTVAESAEAARPEAFEAASSRAFGTETDARVTERIQARGRAVWTIAAAVALAAAYAYLQSPPADVSTSAIPARAPFKSASRAGLELYRFGRFDDALKKFADADASGALDAEASEQYAALLVRADQTQLAKRKLDKFINEDSPMKSRALAIRAAASIADGDLEAGEKDGVAALDADPENVAAALNAGAAEFGKRQWAQASARFRAASRRPGSHAALAAAMFGIARLNAGDDAGDAVAALTESSHATWDFKQEAHVLLASAAARRGDAATARAEIAAAVASDPFATESFWHDPAISLAPLSWNQSLLPLCRELANDSKDVAARSLLAVCEQKAGHNADATAAANDAIARAPNEPLPHAAAAFVAIAQSEGSAAEAALKIALERAAVAPANDPGASLAYALEARLCWRKRDFNCAGPAAAKIRDLKPRYPFVDVVLARAEASTERAAASSPSLESARKLAPNFIPLMELGGAPASAGAER